MYMNNTTQQYNNVRAQRTAKNSSTTEGRTHRRRGRGVVSKPAEIYSAARSFVQEIAKHSARANGFSDRAFLLALSQTTDGDMPNRDSNKRPAVAKSMGTEPLI